MAGLGGFMGYSMGGINWDATSIGRRLGGHVKAVFTIITFIFIACVSLTVTSFKEIPLWSMMPVKTSKSLRNETDRLDEGSVNYGALDDADFSTTKETTNPKEINYFNNVIFEDKCDGYMKNAVLNAIYRLQQISDHTPTRECLNLETKFFDNPAEKAFQEQSDYFADDVQSSAIDETSFTAADDSQPPPPSYNTTENKAPEAEQAVETLSHYLLSILYMPHSLRMVCLTNLFCWMAHVCYSLYFTDFVGEAVFKGDPKALEGSQSQILYEEGVRFGCWGMAMYSLSCAVYSLVIEKLIHRFKAKNVYVGGLLFYCVGMMLMAMTRAKSSVIIFSWAAGVMYSTLFTMPYLLIAHYHSMGTFELDADGAAKLGSGVRGLGTDVAIVSSMVFLAQFILSICMGTIVSISGTTTAVVSTASFLSFCGALSATQIMYLDL